MATLPAHLQPLLRDVRAALEDLYGDRLVELVLYGSQARGDTHAESDVDLLVVLDGPVDPGREIRRMSDVCFELSIEHEVYLSALPVSSKAYTSMSSAWLMNAKNEGVPV